MSIYGSLAHLPVTDLLALLDQHPDTLAGTCLHCRTACAERYAALAWLAHYGVLPRRRPGASRPELVGARRVRVS